MGATSARPRPSSDLISPARGRLQGSARRDALLDAAVALVKSKGVHVVSMEAVAERAGVSRPLVYKHFANRGELLTAAYRREASRLHADLAVEVASAANVEEMYRALLRGSMRATVERGHIFTALRDAVVEPRHSSGAAIERSPDGSGLRRRGGPSVWARARAFHLGHWCPVRST